MRLTLVGTGTAAPEPERACSAYLLQSGDTALLLDCGPGTLGRMARFGLPWHRIDHVVLSHFHNDHIGDLPALFFALKWGVRERRTSPLSVWAPHGIQERLRAMQAAFGDHLADPGFPVLVREIGPGDRAEVGHFSLAAASTPHTPESLAFRLQEREAGGDEGGGRPVVAYTGDTGPSDDVARFLSGAEILIAECSLPDDQPLEIHLTPTSLAAMAAIARPARLVVTHVYPWLDALDVVGLVRSAGWEGAMVRAEDGLAFDLSR